MAAPTSGVVRLQGWKLHISASIRSAEEILRRSLPILMSEEAAFKVVSSLGALNEINHGRAGISQVGKFITIYPRDDDQAVRLAIAIDEATTGLESPSIPSDRRLSRKSVVHYRYGGFKRRVMQMLTGELVLAVSDGRGNPTPDLREGHYSPPDFVSDPFAAHGLVADDGLSSNLVCGRYVVVRTLQKTPRGLVQLGFDTQRLRRVVLKRAAAGVAVTSEDCDARDRLRYEAEMLKQVGCEREFPEVYDLFTHNDELILVMEDIAGLPLLEYVERCASECILPRIETVVDWGAKLAAMFDRLHALGWSYGDLKPANVIITPEGVLRMLDAEALARIGSHRPFRLITPGYCSPEQERDDVSGVLDDVYALGALLRFALTGCDLRSYLDASAATRLSLWHWNPFVNTDIDYVVRRCLNAEPQKRFRSMSELRDALVRINPGSERAKRCGGRNDGIGASLEASISASERTQRADEFARKLGDTLLEKSQLMTPQDRRTWVTRAVPGLDVPIRDLGLGAAGVVLALAALVEALGGDAHRAALRQGANWLAEAERPEGPGAAGLYAGEAGVGAALLRAGQALSHEPLIEVAEKYSRSVSEMPHICPDLYGGSAGRVRFHLMVWGQTGKDEHLSYALDAGHALLAGMRNCGAGWAWPFPRECGSLS